MLTAADRDGVLALPHEPRSEQWIKQGKEATNWTRFSYHRFRANEVRLLLGVIAHALGNHLHRLVLPVALRN